MSLGVVGTIAVLLICYVFFVGKIKKNSPDGSIQTKGAPLAEEPLALPLPDETLSQGSSNRSNRSPSPGTTTTTEGEWPGIQVLSQLGFALSVVEVSTDDVNWTHETTDPRGRIQPPAEAGFFVRAPGHQAVAATHETQTLYLPPKTSLQVVAPNMSDVLLDVRILSYGLDLSDYVASGTLDGRWAIAFDAGMLRSMMPRLKVEMDFADDTTLLLAHELVPEKSATFVSPVTIVPTQRAPLNVKIRGSREVDIDLWGAESSGEPLYREHTDWGDVILQSSTTEKTLHASLPDVVLENIALGRAYGLSARDVESGAHARLLFVHDGSERNLALSGGLLLSGTLSVPAGWLMPTRAKLQWEFSDAPGTDSHWRGVVPECSVESEGRWACVLPSSVPRTELAPDRRPPLLKVLLACQGFRERTIEHYAGDEAVADLGVIELEPLTPDLVVIGERLESGRLSFQSVETTRQPTSETVALEIREAFDRPDGSIGVELNWKDGGVKAFAPEGTITANWDAQEHMEIVLTQQGYEGYACVAGADGVYRQVATIDYSVSIKGREDLVGTTGKVCFGWEWRGIRHQVGAVDVASLREQIHAEFPAPQEGAALWWSLNGEDATRSQTPLKEGLRISVP